MYELLQNTPNLFSSCRVDTPFQNHLDLDAVYQAEYETLKSIIGDIKRDPNRQSTGAVVIGEHSFTIGFLHVNGNSFVSRIRNFNQLVAENPKTQFRLIRDNREPQITNNASKTEVEKLNRSRNGTFTIMQKTDKIHFELTYSLIVDILNHDLITDLATALPIFANQLGDHWIKSILQLR